WGLEGSATFDDARLGLHLPEPPAADIPTGDYRLISAVRTADDAASEDAHLLRLTSPLGQWLLSKAKDQRLVPSLVQFDLTGHDRKVTMLAPFVGHLGWLRLDKLTLDSDARE